MGMRWRFAEDTDPVEARSRGAVREAIDRWWEAFAKNADRVDEHFRDRKEFDLRSLMDHLSSVDPNIMWEFGPPVEKPGHRLCITPESHAELRPLVQVILDRSPELPRWEFYPYRLPDEVGDDPIVRDGRTDVSMEGATVSVSRGDGNRIDLSYFVYSNVDKSEAKKAAFFCTERRLGEECLDKWIGGIDGNASSTPEEKGSRRVSLGRLRPTVEALIDSIHSQLPTAPRYQLKCQPNGQPFKYSLLELNLPPQVGDCPRWLDQLLAVAPEVELFNATRNSSFYSTRYSRFNETFCYLKIGEVLDAKYRGEVEDAITSILSQKDLGCAWGGGTGKRYSYIELALIEVESAIPILRELLRRFNIHQRTWLLFHDASLQDEWVGIYPQTPPPPV
jgi:hypothetical protein